MSTVHLLNPRSEVRLALLIEVSKPDSVAALFDKVKTRCHVHLSIVVNSAGFSRTAEFMNTSEDLLHTLIAVNIQEGIQSFDGPIASNLRQYLLEVSTTFNVS